MKTKLNQIGRLHNVCVNDVYNIIYKKCNKKIDLNNFPFYVIYSAENDVIAVRITKIKIDDFNQLIFIGTDTYHNKYEFDEGSDIINFMGFDMYNSVIQEYSLINNK